MNLLPFSDPGCESNAQRMSFFRAVAEGAAMRRGYLPVHLSSLQDCSLLSSRDGLTRLPPTLPVGFDGAVAVVDDALRAVVRVLESSGGLRNRPESEFFCIAEEWRPAPSGGLEAATVFVALRARATPPEAHLDLLLLGAEIVRTAVGCEVEFSLPPGSAMGGVLAELPEAIRPRWKLDAKGGGRFPNGIPALMPDDTMAFECGDVTPFLTQVGLRESGLQAMRMELGPLLPRCRVEAAPSPRVLVAFFDLGVRAPALEIAEQLRAAGLTVLFLPLAKNMAKQLREADRLGSTHVVMVGGHEWERGQVALRVRATGNETAVEIAHLAEAITET